MLASRMQKEEALEECAQSPSEVCVDAVAATVGNHEAVERLRSEIEREAPEAHHLLGKAEGRTLVEAPAPEYSLAQFAFMSPAAVEGGPTQLGYTAYGAPQGLRGDFSSPSTRTAAT